jgi:type VI protein secretion system component Hcp
MILKAAKYVLGLVIAFQFAPQCFAQDSIFAKFDPLICQGAANRDFPGSAVSSVAFGGTEPSGTARISFADIKLVKTLDDCTPLLFKSLAKVATLNPVTITIVTPATSTSPARPLIEITLSTVRIASDEFAEAVGGRPSEVVTLSYVKITIRYVPTNFTFTFDRQTGVVS